MSSNPQHRNTAPPEDAATINVAPSESATPSAIRPDQRNGISQGSAHRASGNGVGTQRDPVVKENDHSQSLRSKLVLALALMLGVVVGIDEVVRQKVIAPEFANLERVAALKDTNRVLSAINTEVEFLAETAAWDARRIRELIENDSQDDHGVEWPERAKHAIEGLGERIEWAAIINRKGDWTWLAHPPHQEPAGTGDTSPGPTEFPGITERIRWSLSKHAHPHQDNLFRDPADEQDSGAGIADRCLEPIGARARGMTRAGDGSLHLFAATPVSGEDDQTDHSFTEQASYYVVGRRFGDEVKADLRQRTSVTFSIRPLALDSEVRKSIDIKPTDESVLSVVWPLLSPTGNPLAELNVELPREVTNRSARTTAFARYLSLCGACVSLMLLLLFLQRIVIGRIEVIREHTERIAQSGIISEESSAPVLRVAGKDEIGQLAKSFDRMRTRLSDAQRRLSDASHAAGMSLVADTVIHNVGNVLTNVNSLIETATRRVDSLRIEPLEKLADRLRSDDVDDALRRATPDYLERLSQTLESDRDDLAALLQTLNDNVQHIHQVIRDQRQHANQPVKWERLDLQSVVDEAVKCSQARLTKDNVRVEFGSDLQVKIWTDRSLLLQILINIIGNAGNATREITSRQPTLRIDFERHHSSACVRFRDNGCGMDDETLSRVFDAHFTTRQSGSGLGLHFCAIAMKRIGGSIRADSEGPDRGATFEIEVPIEKPETANQPTSSDESDRRSDDSSEQAGTDRSPVLTGSSGIGGEN